MLDIIGEGGTQRCNPLHSPVDLCGLTDEFLPELKALALQLHIV